MDVEVASFEKVQQIEDEMFTEGRVDDAGNLVFIRNDGTEVNAGRVSMLAAWPVGSVFINVSSTNPTVLLGGGVWERFSKGRVLVGVDEADADFDVPLETRGEKAVALTDPNQNAPHTHNVVPGGEHYHDYTDFWYNTIPSIDGVAVGSNNVVRAINEQLASQDRSTSPSAPHDHAVENSGGGGTHNNLQPLITVYMWLRTA